MLGFFFVDMLYGPKLVKSSHQKTQVLGVFILLERRFVDTMNSLLKRCHS